ncbi:hypothetical protein MVEN_00714400 [Mycena venus]|uniref:Uncharacterized protein n=1 Tax=Mycena venus TaxID=2733690 RepID=A0A8H6YJT3_9AGAR|nr:hypothetical protein MVEN_00714400 [Mycena venus]
MSSPRHHPLLSNVFSDRRALAAHVKLVGQHETVDQERRRIERKTKLRRKIGAWIAVQQLFIPEVAVLREREDAKRNRIAAMQVLPGVKVPEMKLWLPSVAGTSAQVDESLLDYEYQLRRQCGAALKEMRDKLLLHTREYQYWDSVQGVAAKTWSATRTKGIQARINTFALYLITAILMRDVKYEIPVLRPPEIPT